MATNESKMMHRIGDLASEPKRMLPPIKGYEKQPIVTLEQAVHPIISLVPDVEEMVWTVKQNCQHPPDHLSSDESASIMLYTLEWMPRESSLYFVLNRTLRSQNRQELLPWFLYLRLFMVALAKLPSTTHRTIYRGIKMDVSDDFPEGKTFIWWSFSSSAASVKVLEQFLGQSGHRTMFNIECDHAKDITKHSFYQSEKEVLIYPARQFQVVSSFDSGNELKIIQLREIQPPFPLIHIPKPSKIIDEISPVPLSALHISSASATTIYENKKLQQLIEQCQPRSVVDLQKQNLSDEDMEIVVREAIINKQCKELNLSSNKITSIGVSIITKALNNNSTLEVLYLWCNCFGDTGVEHFSKMLVFNNCKMNTLSLHGNGITDKGVEYIAQMLKRNTTLRSLLLSGNEMSDEGVKLLTNVLIQHNNTLQRIYLSHHKLISDASVDCLIQMLKHNQTLDGLKIHECSLSKKGKERLGESVQSKKGFNLQV